LPAAFVKEAIMEVIHERVAGLDVHKDSVVACVRIMSGGKAKRECRTFGTTTAELEALRDWITSWECTLVAMEATGVYWLPIWKILLGGAFEMNIANARHIKAVPGRKTDMNDAMWIADLAAYGLIRASFVPDEEFHELRTLTRTRKQLVRDQTSHVQRIQKTLTEANIRPGFGDQRHHGRQRSAHDRGDHRGRSRSRQTGGAGRPAAEGHAEGAP
jgi:transposase